MNNIEYYGDVEVVVKMRYRVATLLKDAKDVPPEELKQIMLACLQGRTYDDITDTEQLSILEVLEVGENAVE
jgi:hypothetical protein